MPNPLARMEALRQQSEVNEAARENYARFLVFQRDSNGWTEQEIADYKAKIKVLMGKDDAAALDLFPAGFYKTADEARQSARTFWQAWCDMMLPKNFFARKVA